MIPNSLVNTVLKGRSMRDRMHSVLLLLLMCSALWAADYGKKTLEDRVYYLHVPAKRLSTPRLFVWLHPASGNAQPQFTWWLRSRLFNTGTILLAPQAKAIGWSNVNDESFLVDLIAQVMKEYNVPAGHVYLGGHSSGAGFTWYYGLKHQDLFAALFPACGVWHAGFAREKEEYAPDIYIYHSRNDPVIPFSHSQEASETLIAKGFTVKLIEDSEQHSIGVKMQKLVKTVLSKRLKVRKKVGPEGKAQ
jgi:predicted esterase